MSAVAVLVLGRDFRWRMGAESIRIQICFCGTVFLDRFLYFYGLHDFTSQHKLQCIQAEQIVMQRYVDEDIY